MKIIQLNAWTARLDKPIIDLLAREKPDIVCLQEVVDFVGSSGLFATFKEIAEGFAYSFHSPVMSFNFMRGTGHFGNGILSQQPFIKQETIFTNLEYVNNFSFEEHDYNIRNLQHAEISLGDRTLHVLNHHGHHIPGHKNGNQETERQCKQIAEYIQTLSGNIILTGDFNLSPDSKSLSVINEKLRNLPMEYEIKTTRTQFTPKKEVCDYIFVSDQVKVRKFDVLDDLVSDHSALLLEFDA